MRAIHFVVVTISSVVRTKDPVGEACFFKRAPESDSDAIVPQNCTADVFESIQPILECEQKT